MKRSAFCIDRCKHAKTFICVDDGCKVELLNYLMRENVIEEFRLIRTILKEGLRNREKYCKCDVSDKARNMFEMRFTNNGKNDRIYCQEVHRNGKRFILMAELFEGKKSNDIPKIIKYRIETIGGYDYEIKEN
ncbi:MAG TPA: hypothetical protein VK666_26935 [Chryseolinea sp.]|nr:hypothetical protein [Chryseolinea sp.]